ncbi:MAG: nitrogenase iron-molybdenum cofactor biosynthesis protein NifN [Magnetococcales bacterium]|nr:nitrogenase iron-molybdenum cofactor biosynthesis protein NifN [Magnetococcales bacterium]
MANLIKRSKALSVRPVKSAQTLGAILAFQGVAGAIPILHGSQGCSAFAKVFFVRHFNEPIPLQTTAMDQIGTVMGGEANMIEGLEHLAKGSKTRMIGLISTGLTETQGGDIDRMVATFREGHPELAHVRVVAVHAPDFSGCLETGHGGAVRAMIDTLVKGSDGAGDGGKVRGQPPAINMLVGAHLTPAEVESLKDMVIAFGLNPLVVPDLSTALDGHLGPERYSPVTTGGVDGAWIERMGGARATLVIGDAMNDAADLLARRTGIVDFRFSEMMGLDATDRLSMVLAEVSGNAVPERYRRQRQRLLDAMLDCHFHLGGRKVALAGDPDGLLSWGALLEEVGMETPAVVTSVGTKGLAQSRFSSIRIGDLEDLEDLMRENPVHLLIGNAHVADLGYRRHLPVVRCGYPLFDWMGGQSICRIGYEGARQTLFEMTNLLLHSGPRHPSPYRSRYATTGDKIP